MVRGRVGNVMRVMVHRGRRRGCRDIAPLVDVSSLLRAFGRVRH